MTNPTDTKPKKATTAPKPRKASTPTPAVTFDMVDKKDPTKNYRVLVLDGPERGGELTGALYVSHDVIERATDPTTGIATLVLRYNTR